MISAMVYVIVSVITKSDDDDSLASRARSNSECQNDLRIWLRSGIVRLLDSGPWFTPYIPDEARSRPRMPIDGNLTPESWVLRLQQIFLVAK